MRQIRPRVFRRTLSHEGYRSRAAYLEVEFLCSEFDMSIARLAGDLVRIDSAAGSPVKQCKVFGKHDVAG